MALIYQDTAIVSVGMSCQAAQQIHAAKPALDRLAGEVSVQTNTPLDWLIARPEKAAVLFETGRFLPDSPAELQRQGKRFLWRGVDVWYWHEPRAIAQFETLRSKFAHTTRTLESLRDKHVLAIWTNGQRNLTTVARSFPDTSPVVGRRHLDRLRDAVTGYFPRCRFWPVLSPAALDPTDPLPDGSHAIYDNGTDAPDDWKGNSRTWRPLLKAAFGNHLTPATDAPAPPATQDLPGRPARA